ncbi:MAG TPA: beta-L-arabinofuranosidase domain-containing protein, partial [Vicinamibacterales bacterium]|nr:beta-L-arabinofuranosidase domain-containing protein [Vicinamibacterales bacterium]
ADAKYIDVMERTLYNGLISGVSLDGTLFFYPNPLESNGQHHRQPWFGVACCPGNITRFLPSVPGYVYAHRGDTLYVNLFAGGKATVETAPGKSVTLVQDTRYPWDGDVRITVTPDRARSFPLKVRIPGWARNEPVPGDLYRFLDANAEPVTIRVNGTAVPPTVEEGYVTIDREWTPGDVVELDLPMPVRRIVANDKVDADHGRVALQRGPLVYAAEWPDNPNGKVRNIVLPDTNALTPEFRPDLLNGVAVIKGRAVGLSYDEKGAVQKVEQPFMAIPYATWANRGRGQMEVWIAKADAAAKPTPAPTLANTARLSHSASTKFIDNIVSDDEPRASNDGRTYFDWWPRNGCAAGSSLPTTTAGNEASQRRCSESEWIEMAFAKPSTVSEAAVYWFDDTGRGGVRVPKSWKLLYKDSTGAWKPVESADAFGVEKDTYNTVHFKPVTATAMRLELVMQPAVSAGVQRWRLK